MHNILNSAERRAGVRRAVGLALGVVVGGAGFAVAAAVPAAAQPSNPQPTQSASPKPTPKPTSPSPCPTPTTKCTIAPAITELVPALNSTTYSGQPLPTTVKNGRAQVVTYNPSLWSFFGYTTMPPVKVKGTGQPGTKVTVSRVSGGGAALTCTATVSAGGTWTCDVPFAAFPMTQILWEASNVKTGDVWAGSYGARQTIGVKSDCGLAGANVQVVSGYTTPIAIDFSGTGRVQTVTADQAPAAFAFGADGQTVRSGWLAPTAGFLAWDRDGDGAITSIDELFGGGVGDGFAQLAQLDANGDGVVDAQDPGYWQLSVWRDTNLNKVTDPGELVPLAQAGVVSLTVAHQDYWEVDGAGNAVYEHGFATLAGGQQAAMNDVYFAVS